MSTRNSKLMQAIFLDIKKEAADAIFVGKQQKKIPANSKGNYENIYRELNYNSKS